MLTALLIISADLSETGWQSAGGVHLAQQIRSQNLALEVEALMPPDPDKTAATLRGMIKQGCGLVVVVPGEPAAYTREILLKALQTLQPPVPLANLAEWDPGVTGPDPDLELESPLEAAVPVTSVDGALVVILPALASAQAAVWEDCLPAIRRCLPPVP